MGGFFRFVVWVALILGAMGAIVYFAFFDVWEIPADDPQFSVSIAPTLSAGDDVLVARHGTPSIGSLMRCKDPDEPRRWVVGRWVGRAGDKVELGGGPRIVNGRNATSLHSCETPTVTLANPATGAQEKLDCRAVEFAGRTYEMLSFGANAEGHKSLTVDPGKIFLVSDNRHMHLDSRDFGSVDLGSCQHLVFRLWGAGGYFDAPHRFTIVW